MDYEKEFEAVSEDYWNSLSYDEQLQAFCAVVRRIHKAELVDKGSYRHVLYNVFKFNFDAYSVALFAGYMDIHNALVNEDDVYS